MKKRLTGRSRFFSSAGASTNVGNVAENELPNLGHGLRAETDHELNTLEFPLRERPQTAGIFLGLELPKRDHGLRIKSVQELIMLEFHLSERPRSVGNGPWVRRGLCPRTPVFVGLWASPGLRLMIAVRK